MASQTVRVCKSTASCSGQGHVLQLCELKTVRILCCHRDTKKADFLFVTQPALTKYKLSNMRCEVIKARDGLELPAYLSLPVSADVKLSGGLPMVLNVHGGPWARDAWGFRPDTQWFANRGYAVLQVSGKLHVLFVCYLMDCAFGVQMRRLCAAKRRVCKLSCEGLLLVCTADAKQETCLPCHQLCALCVAMIQGQRPTHIALRLHVGSSYAATPLLV